jgi:transcriptional regulator with XRE-family HTH domain
MPNKMFGKLMRESRTNAGKSMGETARELNVSVSYVSDVERAARAPLVKEKILVAARFFGVDPDLLLRAAAESRGTFELDANVNPKAQEVGAALTRKWTDLSDAQLERISRIVGED